MTWERLEDVLTMILMTDVLDDEVFLSPDEAPLDSEKKN